MPTPSADSSRNSLFRYLTAEEAADYVAIMDLFSATLLTDLSAAEVTAELAEHGVIFDQDSAESRCRQLVAWGNLTPSIRDARVSTVAEYIRSRSRYQVSKLGGRLHREAVAILHASDGAREVARELLGQIVHSLSRIEALLGQPEIDADALAGEVTTIFGNQRIFTESIRDFYAYLAGILSRYDLGGEEYARFKELLLVYIDLITADVNRHAPAVAHRIGSVLELIDPLLDALAQLPGLTLPDGTPVERAQGRTRSDWEELAAWYDTSHGASGPEQLRAAAGQALGQLITNAKRLLDSSGTGFSRRADFLRLARWFTAADDESAHRLYAAAFGVYPARHLLFGPDEPDLRAGPTTSWWDSQPVHVPLSLRERGDRAMRGRSSRVPDPTADRLRLTAEAQREAEQRQAAAAELALAGALHGATISPAARNVLLDLVADVLARHRDETVDYDIGVRLRALPGRFARLVKAPLPASAPARPARRTADDSPFRAATYVHLALSCAALLSPGVGEQILISSLVDQIRADAAEQSITITDGISDRRQLVAALRLLVGWGVVSETDGSVTAWGERPEDEALLSINRSLLIHLLPSPLYQFTAAEETWSLRQPEPPRRRLRRRLVENPAVFRAEQVTESPNAHRERIRAEVFGLPGDAGRDRYDSLLQLLHTLRAPDVGNRIEEGRLPQILLESLPPLHEAALVQAGEQLDGLIETRAAQERLENSAHQVTMFLAVYQRYAAGTLRSVAEDTLAAADAVTAALGTAEQRTAEVSALEAEFTRLQEQAQQLADELAEIDHALTAIRSREIFKTADDLVQRDRAESALAAAADQALTGAERERANHARAVGDAGDALDDVRLAVADAARCLAAARRGLADARLPAGGLPAEVRLIEQQPTPAPVLVRRSRHRDPESLTRPAVTPVAISPEDLPGAQRIANAAAASAQERLSLSERRLAEARRLAQAQQQVLAVEAEVDQLRVVAEEDAHQARVPRVRPRDLRAARRTAHRRGQRLPRPDRGCG